MKLISFPPPVKSMVLLAVALLLFLSSCGTSKKFTSLALGEHAIHLIDSICMENVQNEHYPGLAISVINHESGQWSRGYGWCDVDLKQAINPANHLFRIGSISKTITAAALGRLSEKQKIDLDASIVKYYPAIPEDKKNITTRQLGGHTAGIRHYKGIEFLSNLHYETVPEALEVFIDDELLFAPGTQYAYTTYGWTLISAVMEGAVDKSILKIIDEEVRTPLRIPDLKPDHIDSIQFNRVQFYEYQAGKIIDSPDADLSNKWSGGGYLCSAEDLARFGFALTGPGYLEEETLKEFTTSQLLPDGSRTNYGIGFRSGIDDDGRNWYGHAGGSVGGTSMLLIYPDEDLVVVTLVNLGSANMDELAWKIAKVILDNENEE